jgi:hypothetical protein
MDWQTKRKVIYGGAFICIVLALLVYMFRDTLFPAPTCFDKKQNGFEEGVDCGGTCLLTCSQSVTPLLVTWSRALQTSTTTYDIVALVANRNINSAAHTLSFTFVAYDAKGNALGQITGTTLEPIDGDFPVVLQNIQLPEKPASVTTTLTDGPHYKVASNPTSPILIVKNTRYEAGDIPRVYATVTNTKRVTLSRIPVRVVLYDAGDNAYAAGETIIPFLDKEGSQDITFTWKGAFKNDPIKVRVYPILDPFTQTP